MKRYRNEFVTVFDDSFIGAGVTVRRGDPTVISAETGSDSCARVKIEQDLKISVEVLIPTNGTLARCGVCEKAAPLPDADGAQYILQNCDGGRICFPRDEGCDDERDGFPVTGWKMVVLEDDDRVLACSECAGEISRGVGDVVRKIRGAGSNTGRAGEGS